MNRRGPSMTKKQFKLIQGSASVARELFDDVLEITQRSREPKSTILRIFAALCGRVGHEVCRLQDIHALEALRCLAEDEYRFRSLGALCDLSMPSDDFDAFKKSADPSRLLAWLLATMYDRELPDFQSNYREATIYIAVLRAGRRAEKEYDEKLREEKEEEDIEVVENDDNETEDDDNGHPSHTQEVFGTLRNLDSKKRTIQVGDQEIKTRGPIAWLKGLLGRRLRLELEQGKGCNRWKVHNVRGW